MLGDLIAEQKGKVTSSRVLDEHGKLEISVQESGNVFGVAYTSLETFHSVRRPDGTFFGEGQGVLMTKDGESATFKGQGVGWLTGQGSAVTYRGAVYFQTASPKLERLNKAAVIYEYDVDENGNTHGKFWEWKYQLKIPPFFYWQSDRLIQADS